MESDKQLVTCKDCLEPIAPEDVDKYNYLCYECAIDLWDEYMEATVEYGDIGFLYRQ